ncbi:MAG: hypothetical protein AB9919_04300 [Geobacteraceae bacterium]
MLTRIITSASNVTGERRKAECVLRETSLWLMPGANNDTQQPGEEMPCGEDIDVAEKSDAESSAQEHGWERCLG